VVGVVVGVETESFNSPRYVIDVERRVFEGEEPEGMVARAPRVFPPLNGIRSWLGGRTDGVELEADVEKEAS
jgi:hypothetical protein